MHSLKSKRKSDIFEEIRLLMNFISYSAALAVCFKHKNNVYINYRFLLIQSCKMHTNICSGYPYGYADIEEREANKERKKKRQVGSD